MSRGTRRRPMSKRTRWLVAVVGVSLVGAGAWGVLGPRLEATRAEPKPLVQNQLLAPGEEPIEVAPLACADDVPDDEPLRLSIDALDVEGCVQRVGLDPDGRIGTPANIHVVGWFTEFSTPGAPGLSVLDGHNQGKYAEGVFVRLGDLEPGETFSIERGDGSELEYVVESVEDHDRDVAVTELQQDASAYPEALAIITCTGTWDRDAGTRSERVVVIATPVASSTPA